MADPEGVEAIVQALDWTSDLSRRVVAVIYAYFDDSGTDKASPVAVMAGYIAPMSAWREFEAETKGLYQRDGIPFFRAKLFDHGQEQFQRWNDVRRLRFATEWFEIARKHILRGVSSGVVKADFKAAQERDHPTSPRISPQTYALQIAIAHLCNDSQLWQQIEQHGLSVIVESSTTSDEGMRIDFERVAEINEVREHLRSITFASKADARALNLADYLAYYSHRFALTAMHDSQAGRTEFLNIAQESVDTIMKLGETYAPNPQFHAAFGRWRRALREKRSS